MVKENNQVSRTQLIGLIMLAYMFSLAVRMIWVYQFQGNPDFYWNNQLMINTNDGYTWASSVQKILYGMHEHNPGIRGMWENAIVFLTVLLVKITPFSLETIILYMPAMISSLVVIPIILITKLYHKPLWGFFAALLGSIAWSYYNRTMTGYYDTDMFSAMAPMFILYFLMKSTVDFNLRSALYAALAIAIYPFLYNAGATIVNAMGVIYAIYLIVYHREEKITYYSIILVFLSLIPFPLVAPFSYLVKIVLLLFVYKVLENKEIDKKHAMIIGFVLFFLFMYFGNVFGLIFSKIAFYTTTGTATEGLHFYSVSQTIREAGKVLFFPVPDGEPYRANIAHRMMGSSIGLIMAVIGYILLVIRHRAFLLAFPLIGIGLFAHWGGLRFTVYAVPVAAISAVYLFHVVTTAISDKKSIYIVAMSVLTASMVYPNISHIIEYRVPTVMNSSTVKDLDTLKQIANSKDYTLAWWDYGYPIWFYSNTNTIIDGGKHQNDNFIISKIMQTSSPELAANLSRLAVETYVDSNYSVIADTLFKNGKDDQRDPNLLLSELESGEYVVPKKSRDIYLYLPYRMLPIFPTVVKFGNLDLKTGTPERRIMFYPTRAIQNNNGVLQFANGLVFNTHNGELNSGREKILISKFVITELDKNGNIKVTSHPYYTQGEAVVLYMKNYGKFIVMDNEIFQSMYVQMFILGKYDKELFEPVVVSPYSRIYRLKR